MTEFISLEEESIAILNIQEQWAIEFTPLGKVSISFQTFKKNSTLLTEYISLGKASIAMANILE